MKIDILYQPAHALAKVALEPGESIVAESGAMVGMDPQLDMQTQAGGVMQGIKRMFGGESFFRNTFAAKQSRGEVLLSQPLCGDMQTLDVGQQGLFVQSTSYVASTPDVDIQTKLGGFKAFFGTKSMFVLKATSHSIGKMLIGGFGGLEKIQCNGKFVIDTGHLVAWDATLKYKVGKSSSGWITSFLSGEGLVCHFEGQGNVYIQTRNPSSYGSAIGQKLPPRSN